MKLIRQSRLYFREGNSDKVYEIDLCELSPDEYVINFRYGRRGAAMKDGTKTPAAVSREKAEAVFAALENEKRHKGYRSETEMFIDLPAMDVVEPDSLKGVVLQRLQDAVTGKNTFKTKWKTSRVIWKAGELQLSEAIPYIMKLVGSGDELHTYAALWALGKLKAEQARNLFETYTFNLKQKAFLRNIACEALIDISQDDQINRIVTELLGRLPAELRYSIEIADTELFRSELVRYSGVGKVDFFADLYLLCKTRRELTPALIECIKTWAFKPPYFRQIRALYKLAQMRGDCAMIAALSYRFEKEPYMFKRTKPMESKAKQQIPALNQSVNVGAELRSKDSLLAFSQFTKAYFQKSSIRLLKDTGKNAGAAEYLKLAVPMLLQFTEDDYSREEERPQSYYGQYHRVKKLYYFTLTRYPECSGSLLLTTILFGNDKSRKLMSNLKFTSGTREVCGQNYYYSAGDVRELDGQRQTSDKSKSADSSTPDSPIVSLFKKLIGKSSQSASTYQKQETGKPDINQNKSAAVQPESKSVETNRRLELYPEHWDAMPEAYVQLLMQARMNMIHRFAYSKLKARNDFDEICRRFDAKALLALLNSPFEIPRKFGFETIESRSDEFYRLPSFVASMLGSAGSEARKKARELVQNEPEYFLDDIDFAMSLLFDTWNDNHSWIEELLQRSRLSEERRQSLAGKSIVELLNLEPTPENNDKAIKATGRLNTIAGHLLENIGWNIVEQLVSSPLRANMLLASNILIRKTEKVNPAAIPVELTGMFIDSELIEVRTNGVRLLNNYPSDFLNDRLDFLLRLAESAYGDVVEAALAQIRTLVRIDAATGDAAVHSLVYALMRKEKYEGAHKPLNAMVHDLKASWNTGLNPKDIVNLMHSQYRQSHLTAYEILKNYNRVGEFTLGQIISFGNHEILAVRQWCYNYFMNNVARIRYERERALDILDSNWDDTRAFAFRFFRTEFTADDWDVDTLVGITDSVRPDVESFGKELITMYFKPENAMEYLVRLSEHPSVNVQSFVTNYLTLYAADKPDVLRQLDTYFRSVLMRVNRARVAKDRVFTFLHREALKSEAAAGVAVPLLNDLSAQSSVRDKATCIDILTDIKKLYPDMAMNLALAD